MAELLNNTYDPDEEKCNYGYNKRYQFHSYQIETPMFSELNEIGVLKSSERSVLIDLIL